jgi:hypothetical protein
MASVKLRVVSCIFILLLVATVPASAAVVEIAINGFTVQAARARDHGESASTLAGSAAFTRRLL